MLSHSQRPVSSRRSLPVLMVPPARKQKGEREEEKHIIPWFKHQKINLQAPYAHRKWLMTSSSRLSHGVFMAGRNSRAQPGPRPGTIVGKFWTAAPRAQSDGTAAIELFPPRSDIAASRPDELDEPDELPKRRRPLDVLCTASISSILVESLGPD